MVHPGKMLTSKLPVVLGDKFLGEPKVSANGRAGPLLRQNHGFGETRRYGTLLSGKTRALGKPRIETNPYFFNAKYQPNAEPGLGQNPSFHARRLPNGRGFEKL